MRITEVMCCLKVVLSHLQRQNYEDTGLPKGENELFYFQTVTERIEDLMNLTLKPLFFLLLLAGASLGSQTRLTGAVYTQAGLF